MIRKYCYWNFKLSKHKKLKREYLKVYIIYKLSITTSFEFVIAISGKSSSLKIMKFLIMIELQDRTILFFEISISLNNSKSVSVEFFIEISNK